MQDGCSHAAGPESLRLVDGAEPSDTAPVALPRPSVPRSAGRSWRSLLPARRFVAIGIVGGIMSGLLGVGGGTVMVPMLVLWGALPQRQAHAISLGAIIPISVVGVITYGVAGEIRPVYALALALGAIVGARLGAGLLSRASEDLLKLVFGVFLVVVAGLMMAGR